MTEPKRSRTAGASRRGVSARPDRVPARTLIPTTSSTPSTSAIRNRAVKPYSSLGNPSWRMTRTEEHTSELQSLMRTSYDVFCLKKKLFSYKASDERFAEEQELN